MYFLCPVLWISINCFAKKCAIYNWALHGSRWSIHPKSFYLDLSWVSLSHRRSIFLCSKSFLIASRCFRVSASLRAFEFAGRWLLRTTEICFIISTFSYKGKSTVDARNGMGTNFVKNFSYWPPSFVLDSNLTLDLLVMKIFDPSICVPQWSHFMFLVFVRQISNK